jgi:hypothetical protein
VTIRYCDHSHVEMRDAPPVTRVRVKCGCRATHLYTPDGAGNYLALCDAHYRQFIQEHKAAR